MELWGAACGDADAIKRVTKQAALRLQQSFRSMRAQGFLCDLSVSMGSETRFAHQAVMAAMSMLLREQILAQNEGHVLCAPELKKDSEPLEIVLTSGELNQGEEVQSFLNHCYGEGSIDGKDKNEQQAKNIGSSLLLKALQVRNLDALELAVELQKMQEDRVLCDIVLCVGSEYIPAHQLVLASAGGPLYELITSSEQSQKLAMKESNFEKAACPIFELELCGTQDADAARVLVDFLYGRPSWLKRKLSAAASRDVLLLATSFHLPDLQLAEEFRLEVEEFVDALSVALSEDSPGTPQQRKGALDDDEERLATPLAKIARPARINRLSLQTFKYSSTEEVPQKSSEHTNAVAQLYSTHDNDCLQALTQLFSDKPLWHEPDLKEAKVLGHRVDPDLLRRFLPFVAYQCKGGPWHDAYIRLAYDPRKDNKVTNAPADHRFTRAQKRKMTAMSVRTVDLIDLRSV